MFDQTEFKKNGNYYSVICRIITEDVREMVERFCIDKMLSGENPSTGIVVSSEFEISYLTLYEAANGRLANRNAAKCEYMLEF